MASAKTCAWFAERVATPDAAPTSQPGPGTSADTSTLSAARAVAPAGLAFCSQSGIRYDGAVVYRSMLTAAQNCYERLDDSAMRALRYIERHAGASKSDLSSAFNTLNRILQVCSKEVEKANSARRLLRQAARLADSLACASTPGDVGPARRDRALEVE